VSAHGVPSQWRRSDHHITVADLPTGEVLSIHLIEPNKSYWRNQMREPGRWPSAEK
jgi:hypothetical protein